MNFVCGPPAILPKRFRRDLVPIALYEDVDRKGVGSAGTGLIRECQRVGLDPARRAWDLVSIALAVVSADQGSLRARSPDGWTRELEVTIAVCEPDFWSAQAMAVNRLLAFLTGDIWRLAFSSGGAAPAPPARRQSLTETAVTLLSGGLDSLVGTLDQVANGGRLLAVSQVAAGDKERQKNFARTIGGGLSHLQLNHNSRPPGTLERSQRARSLIFVAFGTLAVTSLAAYHQGNTIDLFVAENGFISVNVPLTPLRVGSLSTRTTHPLFVRLVQTLLNDAALRVRLVNPYQFKTKGEMLVDCRNQSYLRKHASTTTSCARFARNNYNHCGRCLPCLIRRAAFLHWGQPDRTGYVYSDLSVNDEDHKNFEDVRAAGMAIERVRQCGIESWIGPSLNRAQLGNITPFVETAHRGLNEIAVLLQRAGAL